MLKVQAVRGRVLLKFPSGLSLMVPSDKPLEVPKVFELDVRKHLGNGVVGVFEVEAPKAKAPAAETKPDTK